MGREENVQGSLCLFNLAFGIAEAVILSQNTGAKHDDCTTGGAIWYCILVTCLFHWMAFIQTPLSKRPLNEAHLIGLGVSIWTCVIFFQTSSECKDSYEYNDLWNMLFAEVLMFFISLGLMIAGSIVLVFLS